MSELSIRLSSLFRGRCLLLLLMAILLASSTGCMRNPALRSLLEEPIIDYRDMVWARRAYNLRYGNCDRAFTNHFRNGFVEGYCSVCEGGDGYVPALPPEEYWGYEYQSAEGSQCVNAWFEGYPLGAAAARKDNAGKYHDVYISKMINNAVTMENAANVLPEDVPVRESKDAPQVNPELRIDSPPKPITRSEQAPVTTGKPFVYGQTTTSRIPVDPADNVPLPMSLKPVARTASPTQTITR